MDSKATGTVLPHLTFYFDLSSPYAHLTFERLPELFKGCSYSVSYDAVHLPQILNHSGLVPDDEVHAPQAGWIKRHCQRVADSQGLPFKWPARYPFNSLPYLRLIKACAPSLTGTPGRWVVETALRHLWQQGLDPAEAGSLAALRAVLAPQVLPEFHAMDDPAHAPEVQAAVEASNALAIEQGILEVPTIMYGGQWYNGLDRMEVLAEVLRKAGGL